MPFELDPQRPLGPPLQSIDQFGGTRHLLLPMSMQDGDKTWIAAVQNTEIEITQFRDDDIEVVLFTDTGTYTLIYSLDGDLTVLNCNIYEVLNTTTEARKKMGHEPWMNLVERSTDNLQKAIVDIQPFEMEMTVDMDTSNEENADGIFTCMFDTVAHDSQMERAEFYEPISDTLVISIKTPETVEMHFTHSETLHTQITLQRTIHSLGTFIHSPTQQHAEVLLADITGPTA